MKRLPLLAGLSLLLVACSGGSSPSVSGQNASIASGEVVALASFPPEGNLYFHADSGRLRKSLSVLSGGGAPRGEYGASIYLWGKAQSPDTPPNVGPINVVAVHFWDGPDPGYRAVLWDPTRRAVDIRLHIRHFDHLAAMLTSGKKMRVVVSPSNKTYRGIHFYQEGLTFPMSDGLLVD